MKRLARIWREQRLVAIVFVLAVVLAVFFTVRSVMFAIYWSDPSHALQPVEGWMTPRYIVHAYHIPPDRLADLLGIAPQSTPRKMLSEIAEDRGEPLADLIARVEAEIAARPQE